MNEEDFNKVIAVNLKSVFNMTKAVQKIFLKNRNGSIINISSVVGVKGNAGQSNYAASKSGFIETEMTSSLSEDVIQEWRNGIPLKREGTPLDIGNSCVFLASDLSSYITGQVLHVDGGMLT